MWPSQIRDANPYIWAKFDSKRTIMNLANCVRLIACILYTEHLMKLVFYPDVELLQVINHLLFCWHRFTLTVFHCYQDLLHPSPHFFFCHVPFKKQVDSSRSEVSSVKQISPVFWNIFFPVCSGVLLWKQQVQWQI